MSLRPSPLVFLFTFCLIIIITFTLLFSALLISENDQLSLAASLVTPTSPLTELPVKIPAPSELPTKLGVQAQTVEPLKEEQVEGVQVELPERVQGKQVKNGTLGGGEKKSNLPDGLRGIASRTLLLIHFPGIVTETELGAGLKRQLKQWHSWGVRMFSLYPTNNLEEFKRINNTKTTLSKGEGSGGGGGGGGGDNMTTNTAFGIKEGLINYFPIPGNLSKSQQSLALLYATSATVQDFDWVVKIFPDTLVRLNYLLALLSRSNPRAPLLLGLPDPRPTAFQPMTFCKAAPGFILSAGLLQQLGPNLLQCFQHIASAIPEEAAWAECLHYFAPKGFPGCTDGEAGRAGWTRFVDLHSGQQQGEWWRDVELKVAGRLDAAVMIGGADENTWERS